MQAWGTMVVTLTMLMVATVDTKIYERCNLAMKLENAGLNGFLGYSIGDCETPVAPCPTHTLSRPLHSDLDSSLSFINSPRPNVISIIAFTTITLISTINTITTIDVITAIITMNTITTIITDISLKSPISTPPQLRQ